MIKKMTAFVVIFVMVAAMWIIPSSASTFTDSLFFNADFNSGSFNDTVGNVEGLEWYNDPTVKNDKGEVTGGAVNSKTPVKVTFKDDADIGRKVIAFNKESIVFYDKFDLTKMTNNFTLEAYVKLPKKSPVGGWGVIAGTYWNKNPDAGVAFTYGRHQAAGIGEDRKFNVLQGDGNQSFLSFKGSTTKGEWMHLVYTHDGTNESYYENGELIGTQAVQQKEMKHPKSEIQGFRIGGFNMVSQFCTNMDCAYVRVYNSGATESDVKALYDNRNKDAAVPSGNGTVTKPTNQPSNGNSGSNNSSNKTDNASTFDLGIVSLAAVTLSSAVVAKKRRR